VAATTAAAGAETVKLHLSLNGVATDYDVAIATTDTTAALILTKVQAGISGSGVTASLDGSSNLVFTANSGATDLKVAVAGDTANYLGLGTFRAATGTSGAYNYTTTTGAGFVAATASQSFEVSINGGPVVSIGAVTSGATLTTAVDALNVALQANSTARASGLVADANGGQIRITSSNGDNFRLNSVGGLATTFGFAAGVTAGASGTATSLSGNFVVAPGSEATGISQSSLLSFSGIGAIGISQSISLNSPDASGVDHSTTIVLNTTNASTLDAAVDAINTKLQQTNDTTLQKIVAVKEYNATSNTEGIRFISSVPAFKVSLGTTGAGNASAAFTVGISDGAATVGSQQGVLVSSAANGTGATADISNQASAQSAVTALASAVSTLGRAQAVVGRGQNQFGYAINLASSQVSNLASAESRIRDADLASEAASLTKASILLQAGIAALAQANSAPQAVLALLRG
jgi:flagellin